MRRKIFPLAKFAVATALAVLAGSFAFTSPATAAESGSYLTATVTSGVARPATAMAPALAWKSFTWTGDLHSGDCTMFHGATWTLFSDGTASFDGTVTSSDDNDAWLMYLHVADGNNAELGLLTNVNHDAPDPVEFAKSMPDHNLQYRWLASGRYDPNWFGLIQHMTMFHRC